MSDEPQVAVYFDFDNIVISRYDELHGARAYRDDRPGQRPLSPAIKQRLDEAHVDLEAVMDYAASFGTVAISRAYANWANVGQRRVRPGPDALVDRPGPDVPAQPARRTAPTSGWRSTSSTTCRGTPYITHVLVVAGDSDYVSLAQRCRRLGRKVIGVGAAHSVGKYWELACDEFRYYDNLLAASSAGDRPAAADPESADAPAADQRPGGAAGAGRAAAAREERCRVDPGRRAEEPDAAPAAVVRRGGDRGTGRSPSSCAATRTSSTCATPRRARWSTCASSARSTRPEASEAHDAGRGGDGVHPLVVRLVRAAARR